MIKQSTLQLDYYSPTVTENTFIRMPDFDDSFLSYCERTERKRKHSYNFNSARNSTVNLHLKGGQQSVSGSRSNLLSTAKNYSKTLPRSFRKNLQKISQYIRDSDSGGGDLHFYDLNHNETSVDGRVGGGRVKNKCHSDKVMSMVDFNRLVIAQEPVELLANRSLEEQCLEFGTTSGVSDEGVQVNGGANEVEEIDGQEGGRGDDEEDAGTSEENNSKWLYRGQCKSDSGQWISGTQRRPPRSTRRLVEKSLQREIDTYRHTFTVITLLVHMTKWRSDDM